MLRPEPPISSSATKGRITAPGLQHVLGAGSDSLRRALARLQEGAVDFEALDAAFDVARHTLRADEVSSEASSADPVAAEREGGDGVSAVELEELVRALEQPSVQPILELEEVAREEASIVVQLLVESDDTESHVRASHRLEELRRKELDEAAAGIARADAHAIVGVLIEAIVELAETLPIAEFDRVYLHLGPTFRRLVSPFLEHLTLLTARMTPHGVEALWPHATDELLIHLRSRRAGLDPRLELPPSDARARALQRLSKLPAIAEGRLDSQALEMDQRFVHGLMLELLSVKSARPVVGRALLSALRRTPPALPWLANVLRAAEECTPAVEPFVQAAVISASGGEVHPKLVELAANVLINVLSKLDPERRLDPWVPGALEWLGDHGPLRALDFLERVQRERKLLRPTWSKQCRRAARAGIKRGWEDA
ncbi:MAG: hypothetical protein R3F49_13270 [Planctomycetota bacterium]